MSGPPRLAIGCLMAISGFFGGGMIAVAIGRVVGQLRRCEPAAGLPACNHVEFLIVGAAIGAVLLPSVVLWRLRRSSVAGGQSERS